MLERKKRVRREARGKKRRSHDWLAVGVRDYLPWNGGEAEQQQLKNRARMKDQERAMQFALENKNSATARQQRVPLRKAEHVRESSAPHFPQLPSSQPPFSSQRCCASHQAHARLGTRERRDNGSSLLWPPEIRRQGILIGLPFSGTHHTRALPYPPRLLGMPTGSVCSKQKSSGETRTLRSGIAWF